MPSGDLGPVVGVLQDASVNGFVVAAHDYATPELYSDGRGGLTALHGRGAIVDCESRVQGLLLLEDNRRNPDDWVIHRGQDSMSLTISQSTTLVWGEQVGATFDRGLTSDEVDFEDDHYSVDPED